MEAGDDTTARVPELEVIFQRVSGTPIQVAGKKIHVATSVTYLPEYQGAPPKDSWRKPIVGPPDRPFAELQLVRRLEAEGWVAAWVHRPGQFLRTWEPREEAKLPKKALALFERIQKRAGSASGAWDIFAWKKEKPRFIELKRAHSSERLRSSQVAWFRAARQEGIPSSAFEVMEWYGGCLTGRVLRLTSYTYERLDGWAEYRNGAIQYGGNKPDGTRHMVDFYRAQCEGTDADLLWFTYVRNSSGITWCGIEEESDKHWRSDTMKTRTSATVTTDSLKHLTLAITPRTLADLPSTVLSMAWKSPGEFGFQRKAAASSQARVEDRLRHCRDRVWPKRERYVNQVLNAILLAAPPAALAALIGDTSEALSMRAPTLHKVSTRKLGGFVGEPDFVLFDPETRNILLGEIKIGANAGNDRYDFEQYTKYMLLGALFRASGLAEQVGHLIVVPDRDPAAFCKDYKRWRPSVQAGQLHVTPDQVPTVRRGAKTVYKDRAGWVIYAVDFLSRPKIQQANRFGAEAIVALGLEDRSPALWPTSVVTWEQFAGSLERACIRHGAGHLREAIQRLGAMGLGG
jgi:hypothetical protein